ncbi:putative bifunctional diguanylate cyclase/phosphodiesterase [Alkalimarinus coralli]|uniref:putative bifunctional diguanylate cyclase/phosphodiesterase n=1 Tax=Alkalimarinus coralli TaxID=2935863 RepID=UPI00202AF7C3|nr:EAL domain-containing protein [Alkalimarinus coralli]
MHQQTLDEEATEKVSIQQLESLLEMQRDILETALFSMDYHEILNQICLAVEHLSPNSLALILEMDLDSKRFRIRAAPSLDTERIKQVNELKFDESVYWLDNTLNSKQPLFISNIQSSPNSTFLHTISPEHQSMVCSTIGDAQATKLGVLCLFRLKNSTPPDFINQLSKTTSYLASLVLQRERHEDHFSSPAYRDTLTSLPNRHLLRDRICQAIIQANHHKMQVALILLDLDRFKHINNSYGHEVGDILLKKVAQRIVNAAGEEYTVARLGGDEFAILVNQVDNIDKVTDLAAHILSALEHPLSIHEHKFYLMGSIGIAVYPHDGQDDETLLSCADAAMYQAKAMGRNQFSFYESSLTDTAHEHLSLEQDLRQALLNRELTTFYQPQVNPFSGRIVGIEALARWHHPTRGLTSPHAFIQVAEEVGLIDELGAIITEQACIQLKQWHQHGATDVRMAINVSGRQLSNLVVGQLKSIVSNAGISPDSVDFELTESYLMHNAEQSKRLLTSLRDSGFHIAIDDFGIGYSSLAYLKRLPIDKLKIDRMLIQDIAHDPNDEAICRAVIALGHSLGLTIVAEGVESRRQQEFLANEGCDILQGFKFGKPMPSDDFEQLLFAA